MDIEYHSDQPDINPHHDTCPQLDWARVVYRDGWRVQISVDGYCYISGVVSLSQALREVDTLTPNME